MRCPICHRAFDSEQSTALPFCGPRCRQIDLGRWLNEDYGVPIVRDDEQDEEDSPGDSVEAAEDE